MQHEIEEVKFCNYGITNFAQWKISCRDTHQPDTKITIHFFSKSTKIHYELSNVNILVNEQPSIVKQHSNKANAVQSI